jgi:Tol biopolymer transport system component
LTRGEALAVRPGDHGAERGLWIVPLRGGRPRRVGNIAADSAAWSQDGERIAYSLDRGLYVTNRAGASVRTIHTFSGRPQYIRWAPGDAFLRFTLPVFSDRRRNSAIWDINPDGSGLERSFPERAGHHECCGGWLPHSNDYLVQSWRQDGSDYRLNASQIGMYRERTAMLRRSAPVFLQLTSASMDHVSAYPSPDGRRIYTIGLTEPALVRYDPASGTSAPFLGGLFGHSVSFSPDGQFFAYVAASSALWRARIDGTDRRRLTSLPLEVDGTAWSPDGRSIAVRARRHPDERRKVYILPAEGGPPEPLVAEDVEQGMPTWSRDGTRLAFGDVPETFGVPSGSERIHIYDRGGKRIEDLPGSAGLWTSRWSPDGRYLAALTIREQELMLFDFTSKRWRSLGVKHVGDPLWTADGRYIYCGPENGVDELRRVSIQDGSVERIKDMKHEMVRWVGLTPDGAPLLLRGSTDIYAVELTRR